MEGVNGSETTRITLASACHWGIPMSTDDSDGKVVQFPLSADERKALRKTKSDAERQKLVNRFAEEGDLFRTPDGTTYADLIIEGARQTWPIRSKQFRFEYVRFLQRQIAPMLETNPIVALLMGPSLTKSAISKAIDDFDLRATCSPIEREVHVRVAQDGADALFVDLCDPAWQVIKITPLGWSVVQSPPVRFRRTSGMRALPLLERGKPIKALRPFLNVSDNDFTLAVGFIVTALRPFSKYPIFVAYGEQGSAKTDLLRIMRSFIDPHRAATTPLSPSGRDLFVAARNSHVLAFENVSKLSRLMSDHLCRLATGGAFRIRALFTDSDEVLLSGARPIMAEGVSNFASEADLRDRSIVSVIDPLGKRMLDAEIASELERLRPGIFGALLDAMVVGLREMPKTRLLNPPRMADFARGPWPAVSPISRRRMQPMPSTQSTSRFNMTRSP
jgi:hypothetical protein